MRPMQILPKLWVGSYPDSPATIDSLRDLWGVTAVLNLQTADDFYYLELDWPALAEHYHRCGMILQHYPVRDFDAEDLRRNLPGCAEALDELRRAGHTVYVHCTMGINRAPTVIIAYLHWIEGWELDEAVAHVTRHHSCEPFVEAIRAADLERTR
jgi:protein-tyrosine phosphatase